MSRKTALFYDTIGPSKQQNNVLKQSIHITDNQLFIRLLFITSILHSTNYFDFSRMMKTESESTRF